jgi:hypothetical protein
MAGCNMPHVRPQEYKVPGDEYELVYVEAVQRHHKRTPYASNSLYREDVTVSRSQLLSTLPKADSSGTVPMLGHTPTREPPPSPPHRCTGRA